MAVAEKLEQVGLSERAGSTIKTFSQGMKQRLGIAVALVHDPSLIILDEPTNGLDPQGIADMRRLIISLSRDFGKTLLVCSHLLSEMEQIATRMLIIDWTTSTIATGCHAHWVNSSLSCGRGRSLTASIVLAARGGLRWPGRCKDDVMRVFLGSDHAGFELKARLIDHVASLGHEPVDCGALSFDPEDDYPAPCIEASTGVVAEPGSLGIVIGGSGNGEQIAANKVRGVRAALVWSDDTARLAREHNDANVISVGARNHPEVDALRFVEIFLATPFSGEARHVRRIGQLADYEAHRPA